MTDENQVEEAEMDALRSRADQLGLKIHPNAKAETVRERIQAALAEDSDEVKTDGPSDGAVELSVETEQQRKVRLKKQATKLVRIRISCMNPNKREWDGEIFSAGNGVVGQHTKYVPYNVAFHVPQIIFNQIKARMCQVFYSVRDPRTGQTTRRGKMVEEFAIEKLNDLTEAELKDLAQRQAMAQGTAEAR